MFLELNVVLVLGSCFALYPGSFDTGQDLPSVILPKDICHQPLQDCSVDSYRLRCPVGHCHAPREFSSRHYDPSKTVD
jgi:hypothetical protein